MDYIALNHNPNNVYGVHYNSPKPIGGIRYYHPDKSRVKINPKTKNATVIVDIPRPRKTLSSENPSAIENENITEKQTQTEIKKISYEDLRRKIYEEMEQEAPVTHVESQNPVPELNSQEKDYIVRIQDKEVNFSKQGILKKEISLEDKNWLNRAQNYFLTAEEDGIKIGSAESYTTMEILEALWRTAEQVGVDPRRFIVQIYNETRFNPNLKGKSDERGLGQFKKSTAKHYGYDWDEMTNGIEGFAYQAKAAAEFVKAVGELAYNGGGKQAENYQNKISYRVNRIQDWDSDCVMRTLAYCS